MQPKNHPIVIGNSSQEKYINQSPIDNSKPIGQIGQRQDISAVVDMLLVDYQDLIDPAYSKWFAKRFYTLPFDQIHAAASESRHDARDKQRMFAFIIKRKYNALTAKRQYQQMTTG